MIKGGLFTRFFLDDGIRETQAYKAIDATTLHTFVQTSRAHWLNLAAMATVNESETTRELIEPMLDFLGWSLLPQQKTARDGRDVPDALLFLSEADKNHARAQSTAARYKSGVMVVEYEARDTRLDRAGVTNETPAGQILRYMSRAQIASNDTLRWGLLTNGRFWRLYDYRAPARAEGFIEFDLPSLLVDDLLQPDTQHWQRVFLLLFRVSSFVPEGVAQIGFVQFAIAEGRKYEQRITGELSRIVYNDVFPNLIAAIGKQATTAQTGDLNWRSTARETALKLLFRLLFLLYAEDRDLLPTAHEGYATYALQTLRREASAIIEENKPLSPHAKRWWANLTTLFTAIALGDDSMGLPPYNGGLFDESANGLTGMSLPDTVLASLIDKMSREGPAGNRRWINYRDLSVQQLGSIYEQLLEQDVVEAPGGGLTLRPNAFSRKTTGSYYTPDELVQLILRRAINPLLQERRDAFNARVAELAKDNRPKAERLKILSADDPATAFVSLRVVDPAMGSGHFLVSLVDFLATQVVEALADAPTLVPWADPPYRSPLAEQIAQLRETLLARARAAGWPVREDQLDDRHLIRRIILKRVIYGVDMNPMAVELAKLSLWLHSFTVGAPLSFLDHHLRIGDSLFGEFVAPVQAQLRADYGFVMTNAVAKAANAAAGMAMVEALTDADITEVKSSAVGFAAVEEATAELRAFLDIYHAARWLPGTTLAEKQARITIFGGGYGDPVAIANGKSFKAPKDAVGVKKGREVTTATAIFNAANAFLAASKTLSEERKFLHWEAAFPGVWKGWETTQPTGGFDAVIGNPPWDRMKLQEVEWFAARKPAIALQQRASDRKKAIAALRKSGDPLAADFARAEAAAEGAARVARTGGAYPLLSGGDINIYSLFVERAQRLVRPDGIVGLLVPSGIAADLGAAPFFGSISTTGRLESLLDFENGKRKPEPFFPDVHRSFKFASLIFAGPGRRFTEAKCAFFQQSASAAEEIAFALTPADFAAVNPNTRTAPVFRNQRDADITRAIYARLPILVDRRDPKKPVSVWPVRYVTMFHMTSDSDKFLTAAELEKSGAYRVDGGSWKKGDERFFPLYEGKMVQAYDHRAASISVNAKNVSRPAQPEAATLAQHSDPSWLPTPQFLVSEKAAPILIGNKFLIALKDVTSPTNVRTIIATIVPTAFYGNTLPVYSWLEDESSYSPSKPLLLSNLNSLIMDYCARQKIQGQHLNSYILEQLPVVPPVGFARKFGPKTAAEIIRDDVLHLTYVSHDMAGFAERQGYTGPPFAWDEADRLRRRARLDALFFHLYGIEPENIRYILSTFPIVIREEIQKYGDFRSEKLILGYYNALAAGDPDAPIAC